MRTNKMWHRDMKGVNTVGKMAPDRLARCRVATNLQFVKKKKKKMQYQWSSIKQSVLGPERKQSHTAYSILKA